MKQKDQPRLYRYDAFISYRHNARDQQIACALLRQLESLPLKNRPKLHIFRDREEFPTSSDLGNDIHKALEESEFLILICSPEYLQSKWCREELVYFRKLHGNTNRNILPILASGEPQEAFPQELFTEIVETVGPDGMIEQCVRDVEPLGADVRAETLRLALKALKSTEYLRIAAAILNCRFDDLYRREQRRIRRKLLAVTAGISAAAIVMISFLLWQLFQVRQAQLHEQLTYSQQLFSGDDRIRARQNSREVLNCYRWPMDSQIQDGAQKLQFLTGYTPQFSVVTHLCPSLSDEQVFFGADGGTVLRSDYTKLERYSLRGEALNGFYLGNKGQKICAVSPDGTRAAILRLMPDGTQVMDLWDTGSEQFLGTMLQCGITEAVDGLQAEFSPDGRVLSVCRIGGNSNSNDQLCLFDSQTGEALCALNGDLLGTLERDGVQDRVVTAFSFLNSDTAHWTGGAYEVFYSISQNSVQRISRNWASLYAQAFPGCRLALGRYAVLNTAEGIRLADLADMANPSRFEAILEGETGEALPVQMVNSTTALCLKTVKQNGFFSRGNGADVLSGFWVCDLTNPDQCFFVDGLSGSGWTEPAAYAVEDCPIVYLSVAAGENDGQMQLIRIDLSEGSAIRVSLNQEYWELVFLGSESGQDFFAGDTGTQTVLFSVNKEGDIRSRAVDVSVRKLRNRFDLATTESGVCLVGEYQGDYCLFSMESKAERLDAQASPGSTEFSVSADGESWIGYRGCEITASHNGGLVGESLQNDILFAGVGSSGAAFIGNTKQLQVWNSEGSLIHSQAQAVQSNGVYEAIRSAKLSKNGNVLVWLTSPSVSGSGAGHNSCTLHSLELSTMVYTDYRPGVFWRGDLPAGNMYDCSADGSQIVFLSDAVIPELRILNLNDPLLAKRQEIFPFDTLNLLTNETLTGVCYADSRHILCTAGSCAAVVDADSLEAIFGICEQSACRQMPQLWPDGTLVYFGNNLNFWNPASGALLYSISVNPDAELVRSQDGRWFSVADSTGTTLYETETYTPAELLSSDRLRVHSFTNTAATYSDARHIYRMYFHS